MKIERGREEEGDKKKDRKRGKKEEAIKRERKIK
jgi:hypothetical protein